MPSDRRRLNRDPAFLESMKKSSSVRSQQDLLSRILDLDAQERTSLKELNVYRTKVNRKQAHDKSHLNSLQKRHSETLKALQQTLPQLGNVIDEEFLDGEKAPRDDRAPLPDSCQCNVKDPFFCIGGYEDWGSQVILSGLGMDLMDALHRYVANEVKAWSPLISTMEVPDSIDLFVNDYHNIWGYTERDRVSKSNEVSTIRAPSWMTLVRKQHAGQTYYDRQLPLYNMLSVTCNSCFIDKREQCRQSSWGSSKQWHQRLAVSRLVQVVVLTGSSCRADSRPLQMELMERMKSLYQGLTLHETDMWIEAIPPNQLLPAESSRLVLQSVLPGQSKPVCLAYLSNLQDYASTDIRHGNTPYYCHMLTGTLCSLSHTMEWILQHGATNEFVRLPKVVSVQQTAEYRRKITINKKGKKIVETIVDGKDDVRLARTGTGILAKPSPDDIRMEALSSPFDFLPFYYT